MHRERTSPLSSLEFKQRRRLHVCPIPLLKTRVSFCRSTAKQSLAIV